MGNRVSGYGLVWSVVYDVTCWPGSGLRNRCGMAGRAPHGSGYRYDKHEQYVSSSRRGPRWLRLWCDEGGPTEDL